ncbi:MAG: hypothetical protein WAV04_03270 [Candidatus Microsaccharimonas sp.]
MTLISLAYNRFVVGVSTDTQLTYIDSGTSAGDAIKSLSFRCANGKFLAAYTGNNIFLEDGVHVVDWVTNLLSNADIGSKKVDEVIQEIVQGLNEKHYISQPAALIILIAGWRENNNIVYRITNIGEDGDLSPKQTFEVFMSEDESGVIVDGSIKIGMDDSFDTKVEAVRELLKSTTPENFRDIIGPELYSLNQIAHNHPTQGKYIGENTMFTFIQPVGDGMDAWRYPEGQTKYMLPNFSNAAMSVKGIVVHNDPVEGGTIQMDIKGWPPRKG